MMNFHFSIYEILRFSSSQPRYIYLLHVWTQHAQPHTNMKNKKSFNLHILDLYRKNKIFINFFSFVFIHMCVYHILIFITISFFTYSVCLSLLLLFTRFCMRCLYKLNERLSEYFPAEVLAIFTHNNHNRSDVVCWMR